MFRRPLRALEWQLEGVVGSVGGELELVCGDYEVMLGWCKEEVVRDVMR